MSWDLPTMPVVTRRQLLAMLGVSAAATAAPAVFASAGAASKAKKTPAKPGAALGPTPLASAARAGARVLVVVELQGGNDGFSTLVPSGDGQFRKLRDRAWLNPGDLQQLDDRYSIAKGLVPVAGSLAFVEGVGVGKPDLSHFDMLSRWWRGDPDNTGTLRTGFLGRCCDTIAGDATIAGVSVGGGATPALISARASTVALPDLNLLKDLTKDADPRTRAALGSLADGGADITGLVAANADLIARARAGMSSGLTLLDRLGGINGKADGYPKTNLASALALVRELISIDAGVRVFHIPWGSFDTHAGQQWSHPDQMRQLGAALNAFRADVASHGLTNRVLLATTSEFGRRPEANAGGTDHGTASTALLMGPVPPGRHGAPVNFGQIDRSGNVNATVSMADYYASLASWLGAPASEVIAGGTPLASLGI